VCMQVYVRTCVCEYLVRNVKIDKANFVELGMNVKPSKNKSTQQFT
jgi:hypothetical protein